MSPREFSGTQVNATGFYNITKTTKMVAKLLEAEKIRVNDEMSSDDVVGIPTTSVKANYLH
jgi:hypothetical protein